MPASPGRSNWPFRSMCAFVMSCAQKEMFPIRLARFGNNYVASHSFQSHSQWVLAAATATTTTVSMRRRRRSCIRRQQVCIVDVWPKGISIECACAWVTVHCESADERSECAHLNENINAQCLIASHGDAQLNEHAPTQLIIFTLKIV